MKEDRSGRRDQGERGNGRAANMEAKTSSEYLMTDETDRKVKGHLLFALTLLFPYLFFLCYKDTGLGIRMLNSL